MPAQQLLFGAGAPPDMYRTPRSEQEAEIDLDLDAETATGPAMVPQELALAWRRVAEP